MATTDNKLSVKAGELYDQAEIAFRDLRDNLDNRDGSVTESTDKMLDAIHLIEQLAKRVERLEGDAAHDKATARRAANIARQP